MDDLGTAFVVKTSINRRGMFETLHTNTGPVGRHLHRIGRRFVVAARGQVGKATLALMNSIGYSVDMIERNPKLEVFADDDIALLHHEGTRPHAIQARSNVMRFSSNGRIQYSRAVMHPGTPPNRYLSDNLYIAKG